MPNLRVLGIRPKQKNLYAYFEEIYNALQRP